MTTIIVYTKPGQDNHKPGSSGKKGHQGNPGLSSQWGPMGDIGPQGSTIIPHISLPGPPGMRGPPGDMGYSGYVGKNYKPKAINYYRYENRTPNQILTDTYATLIFTTKIEASDNQFQNNVLTTPKTRIYAITCLLVTSNNKELRDLDKKEYLAIYVNGTPIREIAILNQNLRSITPLDITTTVTLEEGNMLEFKALSNVTEENLKRVEYVSMDIMELGTI